MQTEILNDYISRDDLAAKLGKTVKTLVRWENDGKGPPVTRIGRDVLYSLSSFERWLKQQERAAKGSTNANAA
jgi:predicted DNA-binding transcriptional regulator AlpA